MMMMIQTLALVSFLASTTATIVTTTTTTTATTASRQTQPSAVQKLLLRHHRHHHRRHLDEDAQEEAQDEMSEDMQSVLAASNIQMVHCYQDQGIYDYDSNAVQQNGVVVLRVCDDANACGCKSSQGSEIAVSLAQYVEAFMEDQQDNVQGWDDDQMDVGNWAQCAEYEQDNDNGNNGNAYYVGPSCSDDGLDIRLALFDDEYCSTPTSTTTTFSDISNGWTLPFADGGLVSTECQECTDNDNGGLKDLCLNLYQEATYKCENADTIPGHYYWDAITLVNRFGNDQTGCRPIALLEGKPTQPFTEWMTLFVLAVLVIGSVAGAIYYTIWWKESEYYLLYTVSYRIVSHRIASTVRRESIERRRMRMRMMMEYVVVVVVVLFAVL